jgi:hypothetical protein
MGRGEMHAGLQGRNRIEKDNLEDTGRDNSITLKWIYLLRIGTSGRFL